MTTAIEPTNPESRIDVFLRKPETMQRFVGIMQNERAAQAYVNSALILINSDPKLQACTTMSLYKSILRSASLELSLDTSMRQGYLVPRAKKIKASNGVPEHYVQEANFQPHYNGIRNLAERTGRYSIINVSPIYAGQKIRLEQRTGLHYIMLGEDTFTMPEQASRLTIANTLDVTDGKPSAQVIGYLGYYKTHKGVERTVWMTIREIHEHAQKWAKDNYNSEYGSWKDPKKLPYMEMKTVFLQLTKTMDLSGKESEKLRKAIEIDEGDNFEDLPADVATGEIVVPEKDEQAQAVHAETAKTVEQLKGQLGF
jgi:phage RecT family recombinase